MAIREWGGEEFDVKDATEAERQKPRDDGTRLWRMLMLLILADMALQARGERGGQASCWGSAPSPCRSQWRQVTGGQSRPSDKGYGGGDM